jgi:hypothetical protein
MTSHVASRPPAFANANFSCSAVSPFHPICCPEASPGVSRAAEIPAAIARTARATKLGLSTSWPPRDSPRSSASLGIGRRRWNDGSPQGTNFKMPSAKCWRPTPSYWSWPDGSARRKRGRRGSAPEEPYPTPAVEVRQPASSSGGLLPFPRRWAQEP